MVLFSVSVFVFIAYYRTCHAQVPVPAPACLLNLVDVTWDMLLIGFDEKSVVLLQFAMHLPLCLKFNFRKLHLSEKVLVISQF